MNNPHHSAAESKGLPGGTVAGIVLGIFTVIIGLAIFLIRRRYVQNRRKKRIGAGSAYFARAGRVRDVERNPPNATGGYATGEVSPGVDFAAAQMRAQPPPLTLPTAPQMSYNNPTTVYAVPAALTPGLGQSSPAVAAPARSLASSTATVQCTFIPTLPDELSISTGETVRVMGEFDDGWALCCNQRGEQGMVPLECLYRGAGVTLHDAPANTRRASSLRADGNRGRRY